MAAGMRATRKAGLVKDLAGPSIGSSIMAKERHRGRCGRRAFSAVDPDSPDPALVAEAAGYLAAGGLVAFPTETVYGLGAHALDPKAVRADL